MVDRVCERYRLSIYKAAVNGCGVICTNCKRMVLGEDSTHDASNRSARFLATHAKKCVVGNFFYLRKNERMKEFATFTIQRWRRRGRPVSYLVR